MTDFILACVCLVLALVAIMLRKAYFACPDFELKRRAAAGDPFARAVYPAIAYGREFRGLLWLIVAVFSAGAIVLFDRVAPVEIGIALVVVWLWLGYSWLPNSRPSGLSLSLAKACAPFFIWLLNWSYPAVKQLGRLQSHYQPVHTGVYESDDLRRFLQIQGRQSDNRIPAERLVRLSKLVEFEHSKVRQYIRPWKDTLKLTPDDPIGPKLLDEMHSSQQAAFCVVKSKNGRQVVGVLSRTSVGLNSGGKVADHMTNEVETIHEEEPVEQALSQFARGSQPLLVVLDDEDQAVGILTLKEALSELVLPEVEAEAEEDESGGQEPNTEVLEEVSSSDETAD